MSGMLYLRYIFVVHHYLHSIIRFKINVVIRRNGFNDKLSVIVFELQRFIM